MGKKKRTGQASEPEPSGPFHNPFAALGGLRDGLPVGDAPPPAAPEKRAVPAAGPTRAVLARERKGRRGKDVTRVTLPGLPEAELDGWLRDLKTHLGCGGAVEDATLILQGDQRERVRAWLRERGVERVSG